MCPGLRPCATESHSSTSRKPNETLCAMGTCVEPIQCSPRSPAQTESVASPGTVLCWAAFPRVCLRFGIQSVVFTISNRESIATGDRLRVRSQVTSCRSSRRVSDRELSPPDHNSRCHHEDQRKTEQRHQNVPGKTQHVPGVDGTIEANHPASERCP